MSMSGDPGLISTFELWILFLVAFLGLHPPKYTCFLPCPSFFCYLFFPANIWTFSSVSYVLKPSFIPIFFLATVLSHFYILTKERVARGLMLDKVLLESLCYSLWALRHLSLLSLSFLICTNVGNIYTQS